ncbi:alpha/beta hydrolase [Streptomyces sp. XM83C]|uniref:alpha/beta fold hydrolase n=1 Tax=unclassified Streptomyces TaxID=2593676 RepID=UPI001FF77C9B|nr:alpha/beta hydrolase [Streptomyces sp. XM83C]MCK1821621.1 alpha/beta hydrolase [Streptomyces sp. XM83C]
METENPMDGDAGTGRTAGTTGHPDGAAQTPGRATEAGAPGRATDAGVPGRATGAGAPGRATGAGAPPTVYLLHGLLGTGHAHFAAQLRAWHGRLRCVPVDLPGHGRCRRDAADDYFDDALRYLLAVLERFGPGRLIGVSYLGGPLAHRCAAARPDLVTSLVLTGFAPDVSRESFLTLIAGFERLAAAQPALAAEYEQLHGPRWRRTLDAVTGHVERDFERTALVRAADVAALRMPVLVLNGSLKSVERAAAEQASGWGGNVTGRVVTGAGHLVGHDRPEEFDEAVSGFWRTAHGSAHSTAHGTPRGSARNTSQDTAYDAPHGTAHGTPQGTAQSTAEGTPAGR